MVALCYSLDWETQKFDFLSLDIRFHDSQFLVFEILNTIMRCVKRWKLKEDDFLTVGLAAVLVGWSRELESRRLQ